MTGRELILYILENNLEDEEVCKDGRILGFMTIDEAAAKFGVGIATIAVWIDFNWLPAVKVGQEFYIPAKSELPNGRSNLCFAENV